MKVGCFKQSKQIKTMPMVSRLVCIRISLCDLVWWGISTKTKTMDHKIIHMGHIPNVFVVIVWLFTFIFRRKYIIYVSVFFSLLHRGGPHTLYVRGRIHASHLWYTSSSFSCLNILKSSLLSFLSRSCLFFLWYYDLATYYIIDTIC